MLLRIGLVVAILAGAGVIAVTQFQVRPHIESIIKEREDEKAAKLTAQQQLKNTKNELAKTKSDLKETQKNLDDTQKQLVTTKAQVESEQKRANGLKQDLDKTRLELTEAQQELSRWKLVGLDPSQIKDLIASEKTLRTANQAMQGENKLLSKKVVDQAKRILELTGTQEDVPLPPTARGKVSVVDPKWGFVVLNVGEKQGVEKNGVLMISRNARLVAKVRIMSVEAERSVANVMPGWKLGEVMEGDLAIP